MSKSGGGRDVGRKLLRDQRLSLRQEQPARAYGRQSKGAGELQVLCSVNQGAAATCRALHPPRCRRALVRKVSRCPCRTWAGAAAARSSRRRCRWAVAHPCCPISVDVLRPGVATAAAFLLRLRAYTLSFWPLCWQDALADRLYHAALEDGEATAEAERLAGKHAAVELFPEYSGVKGQVTAGTAGRLGADLGSLG